MSPFPIYVINEEILTQLEQRLAELGATMERTSAKYLQSDGLTMYQDWVVTFETGVRVVMWGTHPASRPENDKSLQLTVGSPDGKPGFAALESAKEVIVELGGLKFWGISGSIKNGHLSSNLPQLLCSACALGRIENDVDPVVIVPVGGGGGNEVLKRRE